MKGYKVIDFDVHPDERGNLTALSSFQEIPFEIKRIYYTWNMPKEAIRGGHAHRVLDEVMVCLHGSCDFVLDDGKEKITVTLDRPNKGLYVEASLWRHFTNFSPDCVVILIASDYFHPEDHVKDYNEFLRLRADKYAE